MTMIPFPGQFLGGEREELTTMFPVARLGLRTIAGPLRGQTFLFGGEQMIIGRAQDCDVCIASKGVSRHHARIEYGSGNYWLIPEKTTNGTRLNGVLVTAPSQLADKDQIAVHDSTFVVAVREMGDAEMDAAPVVAPPAPAQAPAPPPAQLAQAPTMAMPAQLPAQPVAMMPMAPQSAPVPVQYPPGYSQSYPAQSPTQSYPPGAFPTYQSYPSSSFPVPQMPMSPQGYPTRQSMQSIPYPTAAGLASLPALPPQRTAAWVWVLAVFGAIAIIIAVVVVTVKLMQPSTPAAPATTPAQATAPAPAPAPTPAPVVKAEPAKVEAAPPAPVKVEPPKPDVKAEAAKPEPAKVEAAKPEPAKVEPPKPAQKVTGTLAVEKTSITAQLRGTITDMVAAGTKLERDGAIGHARLYSPQYNAAYAKLVQLQKKYGDSEDYADFIDQAKQEFAAAKARRQLKAIVSPSGGTVTKVSVKPGTEATEKMAVAEIAVARITVPVDSVDGKGKRCTTDLGSEKVFGTMLEIGSSERTLELDKVPAAKPGTFDDIKIICAAE